MSVPLRTAPLYSRLMSSAARYQYKRRRPEETLLYKVIADNIETFIAQRECEGRPLPKYISEEFKSFLTCGLPQFGFWRLKCSKCDHEQILPFSCKKRGFCGSCGAKRAEETSFHLTDNVLPVTPYRQWVVTLPIPMRFWCIANKKLLAEVHKIIIAVISDFYRKNIGEDQIAQTGSVSFTQYFGSNLAANPHFHILFCDGVYTKPKDHPEAEPSFVHKLPPSDQEVGSVLATIADKVIQLLKTKGLITEHPEEMLRPDLDPLFAEHQVLGDCLSASIRNKIAFGERAGKYVRRIRPGFGYQEEVPVFKGERCAQINGFTLHANRNFQENSRDQLRSLISYALRPPISKNSLSLVDEDNPLSDIVFKMKRTFADGTSAILLSPLEMIEKLVGLIPPPKMHLIRYAGVFSANHSWRSEIILNPEIKKGFGSDTDEEEDPDKSVRGSSWAKLLAKTFQIDVSICRQCGGDIHMLGAIRDPASIERYLKCMDIEPRAPPVAAARNEQQSFDYSDSESPDDLPVIRGD